jgi:hypothetical protein
MVEGSRHRVGLFLDHPDAAAARPALDALQGALGDAEMGQPDETGSFDVEVQAPSFEAALQRVWDAVAAAGADDYVRFAEHPDIPEHWRHRAGAPGRRG